MGRAARLAVRVARALGAVAVWLAIALLLAATFVPAFLDRIYYRGPVGDHYDGARFFNPDGALAFSPPPGVRRGNLLTRFLVASPDRAPWPDHVAVTPARPPARVFGRAMRASWVGHATVLIQTGGLNILTDPIWSDVASPFPPLGPHRVAPPGIGFDDLPKIDLVVVSHNHYDHLDLPTLRRLWARDRPVIVTGLGNDTLLRGAGVPSVARDWGATVRVGRATVHLLRNHHWSSRWGRDRRRALWTAFLIETPGGRIFFAGDTGRGDGRWPRAALAYGPVRLAILPIGAFRFYPGQMENDSHIGPQQAVTIAQTLRPALALPIHWGTFRLSSEGYDTPPRMLALFARCAGFAPGRFRAVPVGTTVTVPERAEPGPAPDAAARAACRPGSAALRALR